MIKCPNCERQLQVHEEALNHFMSEVESPQRRVLAQCCGSFLMVRAQVVILPVRISYDQDSPDDWGKS